MQNEIVRELSVGEIDSISGGFDEFYCDLPVVLNNFHVFSLEGLGGSTPTGYWFEG